MKIIDLQQSGDDWLEWRRGGVSATDASILLNLSPYKTRWRLWAEKVGYALAEDLSNNPNVRRGVRNEDLARRAFEDKHDDLLLPVCAESDKYPILRASLDGIRENGEPVEIKCPSDTNWNDVCSNGTGSKPYKQYYPQVQHQLMVTEAKLGWLIFFKEGEPLQEFQIVPDAEMQKAILEESFKFMEEVQKRKEPDKDPDRDIYIPKGKEAHAWIFYAEQYRLYEAEIKTLKEKLTKLQKSQKPLEKELRQMMGDYMQADYCGVKITRYMTSGRINYQKVLEANLPDISDDEVEKFRGKATESCRVYVTNSLAPKLIVDDDAVAPVKDLSMTVESFYF